MLPEMCGEPCTTRREHSPCSTVDRSGYSPQVGIVMCHPTLTSIHLPGSQCAGLAKVSDHAEQWFLGLGKVSDKCRPIIHFSIDVNGVLRIPGSKKLVIPHSLQIGGLSAWLRGRMRDGWSGRTSQPSLPSMAGATSRHSSPNSSDGMSKSQTADGETRGSSPTRPDASAFRGECWTLDIPEFNNFRGASRSEGVVSSLSDVVETGEAPLRYSLAASYAEALTRRAERLGYALPPTMERVLRNVLRRSVSPST